MSVLETVEWLDALAKIPLYEPIGSTKDRIALLMGVVFPAVSFLRKEFPPAQ